MAKLTNPKRKRVASPAQRAALEAGRAKRDAARAAQGKGGSELTGSRSSQPSPEPGVKGPAEQVPLSPVSPTDSLTPYSQLSSESQADGAPESRESKPKARPRTSLDTLNLAFSLGDEPEPEPEPEGKPGLADGLKGIFQSAASLGADGEKEKKSRRVAAHERAEDEVGIAAGEYSPLVAGLFILLMRRFVGDSLAPQYETASSITLPLIRIVLRHYDPLRELSPDGADLLASAGAFSLYMQAIWPYYQQQRAERRMSAQQERMRVLSAQPARNVGQAASQPIRRPDAPSPARRETGTPADTGQSTGLPESPNHSGDTGSLSNTAPVRTGLYVVDPAAIIEEATGIAF